jgi:hypothetical protein
MFLCQSDEQLKPVKVNFLLTRDGHSSAVLKTESSKVNAGFQSYQDYTTGSLNAA